MNTMQNEGGASAVSRGRASTIYYVLVLVYGATFS